MNAICPDFLETPKMSTIAEANITDEIVFPSIKYVSLQVGFVHLVICQWLQLYHCRWLLCV